MSRLARNSSISTQLTLLLAGLVLLITLVLAGVLGRLFTAHEEADIGQQFHEFAMQETEMLDRSLFERYREVQILANRPGLGSPDGLPEKRRLLEDMQKTYAYYAWLGLTDVDGRVLVSANRLLEGVSVAERPWFKNARKGVHLTDVHAAALLAKLLKTKPGEDAPRFIDIAFPYFDADGGVAGVFGIHLSLAWAADIEQAVMRPLAVRRGVETLILGGDGTVIIGPKRLRGARFSLPAPAASADSPRPYAVERAADGKTYLVASSKTQGYGASPGLNWTVVVRQDVDLAYAPVTLLLRQIVLTGGGIAAVFAVLAWWLSSRITRPISALAESARRIEAGESDKIDDIGGGYREIGMLRTALQSLIGKLRANEAALVQADRRKDEFLATLAHELRNPLAPIASSADLLRMGALDAARLGRIAEMIARQTRHLTALIDHLLDVSRVTRGHIELDRVAVDMRDVVTQAIEQVAPLFDARRHFLHTQLDDGLPAVCGDKPRLVQVVANLLNNAAKYTPNGGRIELTLAARDHQIVLAVRDNGIGMSADLMEHVFELFTQETRKVDLSQGGLGVGLALAKRLVEQHGGSLCAASAGPDQGSEFTLRLPAMAAAGAGRQSVTQAPADQGATAFPPA